MILQSLYEYYLRKAEDPSSNMAPEGWEWKEIPFIAVISTQGRFVALKDTREQQGNKKRARSFLVPTLGEKKGNGLKANLLWENIEYCFGLPVPTPAKPQPDPERVAKQHRAFIKKTEELETDLSEHPAYKAIKQFLASNSSSMVANDPLWDEVRKVNANLIFEVDEYGVITDLPDVRRAIDGRNKGKPDGVCLITGSEDSIVRLEAPIKGVQGSDRKAERAFVSFNHDAFNSYGKDQNSNAPVGRRASFAYVTALNALLGRDSANKVTVGDATAAFWAKKASVSFDFEQDFPWYFGDPPKDDPDRGIRAVKSLFEATHSGKLPQDEGDRFYVLGLAPNAARISVRFWKVGTVRDFADKIAAHFDDFEIIKDSREPEYLSICQSLRATALQYKIENVPPNVAGALVESILDGTPYPVTLLHQCIRRIRAEQHVTRARAAILKACLNRFNRFHNPLEKEVTVSLDRTNTSPGYRLGRLFAVLEKIQEEANPGINATIRDRFYGAASSSPVVAFAQLLKLKNHHLSKLSNVGRKVNFEKQLGEIFAGLQDLPAHLSLEEQARFAVGYYHQRQEFFNSNKETRN